MYSNLGWAPAVLALIFGFALLLVDRGLSKVKKEARFLIDIVLGLIFLGAVILEASRETISILYDNLLGQNTLDWLSNNYLWLIPLVLVLSVGLYIWQKYNQKMVEFFNLDEPKEVLGATLILLVMVFLVITLGLGHLKLNFSRELESSKFFQKAPDPTLDVINFNKFGGAQTIDFINNNIPPKAVFDSTDANYVLATLTDVHMASYTFEAEPTKKYEKIYEPTLAEDERLALIQDGQIEYILYLYQTGTSPTPFDNHPQDFSKIYSSPTAAIYQVIYFHGL